MSQAETFAWLKSRGDWCTTAAVATGVHLTPRSVSANLAALERAGLVERRTREVEQEEWRGAEFVTIRYPLQLFRVRRSRAEGGSAG